MQAMLRIWTGVVVVSFAVALPARAQAPNEFQPQVGQAGKDVIWVPTPELLVERMLTMAQTTSADQVIDLGSGDGRIAIMAAKKFGAQSLGIEYNPDMVALSQRNAQAGGVAGKAEFRRADIFETDFSKATVIAMYLLPGLNMRLRVKLEEMKPGTRIVSHQFDMGDWDPDETDDYDGRRAYLWIVPARVQGSWKLSFPGAKGMREVDLTFNQRHQNIVGHVRLGPISAGLREPRLRGDALRFSFVDETGELHEFLGRVIGSSMEGALRTASGGEGRWTATKY